MSFIMPVGGTNWARPRGRPGRRNAARRGSGHGLPRSQAGHFTITLVDLAHTPGVFVEVLPGLNGLVRALDLEPWRGPASYPRGAALTVCIDRIYEDRKRPGFPAFRLSLE